jgi:hypothetical protein
MGGSRIVLGAATDRKQDCERHGQKWNASLSCALLIKADAVERYREVAL